MNPDAPITKRVDAGMAITGMAITGVATTSVASTSVAVNVLHHKRPASQASGILSPARVSVRILDNRVGASK